MADVVGQLAREHGGEELASFAGAYLRRGVGLDGRGPTPADLLAEVRGAFALADGRVGAAAAVRAFTPTRGDHGYDSGGSVVETATDDLPFLVDSVAAELQARGLGIVRAIHPIVGVRRDAQGHITAIE